MKCMDICYFARVTYVTGTNLDGPDAKVTWGIQCNKKGESTTTDNECTVYKDFNEMFEESRRLRKQAEKYNWNNNSLLECLKKLQNEGV